MPRLFKQNSSIGIICLCLGVLVFSAQDALLKGYSNHFPVTEAMTVRAIIGLPVLAGLVQFDTGLKGLISILHGTLVLRAFLSFSAFICYYSALPALPLANVAGLYYVAPLVIVALSAIVLRERLSWIGIVSVAGGFVGILFVLRPTTGVFEPASLLVLMSAFLYATSQILARRLGNVASAPTMAFYQHLMFLIGAPLLALFLATGNWHNSTHPSIVFLTRHWVGAFNWDMMIMCLSGMIALSGNLLITQAYRLTPASKAAVYEYTGMIWTPLWGLLVFAEVPVLTTVIGLLLIVASGLITLLHNSSGAPNSLPARKAR